MSRFPIFLPKDEGEESEVSRVVVNGRFSQFSVSVPGLNNLCTGLEHVLDCGFPLEQRLEDPERSVFPQRTSKSVSPSRLVLRGTDPRREEEGQGKYVKEWGATLDAPSPAPCDLPVETAEDQLDLSSGSDAHRGNEITFTTGSSTSKNCRAVLVPPPFSLSLFFKSSHCDEVGLRHSLPQFCAFDRDEVMPWVSES